MSESVGLENISEPVDIVFTTNYNAEGLKTDVPVIKVSPVMTTKKNIRLHVKCIFN